MPWSKSGSCRRTSSPTPTAASDSPTVPSGFPTLTFRRRPVCVCNPVTPCLQNYLYPINQLQSKCPRRSAHDPMSALAIPRTTSPILDSQRTSVISTSGSSFQTAQSHSQTPSSPSSSTSTLPAPIQHERATSSLPILHQSQEVHLLTITDEAVKLGSSPSPDSLLQKVGRSLLSTPLASGTAPKQDLPQPALFNQSDGASNKVGPPPPSPPASDEQAVDEEISPKPTPKVEQKLPAVTFGTSLRERQPSSTSASSYDVSKKPAPILHRSSTETKASTSSRLGFSTMSAPTRFIPVQAADSSISDSFQMAEASTSSQPVRTKVSNDAFLRPPQVRPKRRNTIGTATPMNPFPYDDIHAEGELANEIQQQQEQLIRERQTKRAKAQQQEAASKDPEKPLVGSWVKEGHQNYVLMYNMLTGIRIAVRPSLIANSLYFVILIL